MVSDFGSTRYCKICEGEIVREGDCITMYPGKKICKCDVKKPKCYHCGKEMEKAIDSRTKEISPYLWECDCDDKILCQGSYY